MGMRENRVKSRMRQGRLAVGTYVGFADPAVVEIIGLAGFDAAFIDMEHSAYDYKLVQEMIRACDLVGITSLVRVPENNPKTILRVLDMGAQGIQVPHIANIEGAAAAVQAVRYAPLGDRGMGGPTRAARYGAVPPGEHMATSNSEILLVAMLEDKEAIDQLKEIASLDGVDLIAIGPSDLSQSLGVTDPRDPKLKSVVEEISLTIRKAGKARMAFPLKHPSFPLNVAELQKLGVAYTNCGPSDVLRLLRSYQEDVREVKAQIGG